MLKIDMHLNPTKCAICDTTDNYTVLYPATFTESDFNVDIFSARRIPDKIHYQIVRCNTCGLVRSNPTYDSDRLYDIYKVSKFTYESEVENLTSTYLDAVDRVMKKLPKDAKILEIGCGNGFILKALFDLGFHDVHGIEPSSHAISKAHESIRSTIKESIFRAGLYGPQSFDFIFLFQTFDHLPDPNAFLKACKDLLKPNGYLLSFNHDVESPSSKLLRDKSPIIDIEHTYLYSPTTISNIFAKHRYGNIHVFSPKNIVSFKHLIWLLPIPKRLKERLINLKSKLIEYRIKIALGNLCIIAQK